MLLKYFIYINSIEDSLKNFIKQYEQLKNEKKAEEIVKIKKILKKIKNMVLRGTTKQLKIEAEKILIAATIVEIIISYKTVELAKQKFKDKLPNKPSVKIEKLIQESVQEVIEQKIKEVVKEGFISKNLQSRKKIKQDIRDVLLKAELYVVLEDRLETQYQNILKANFLFS